MPVRSPEADTTSSNAAVRRTIVRGMAAAAAVGTASVAVAAPAEAANTSLRRYFKTTLKKGSRGSAVKALQKALRMPARSQTGYFGTKTHAAVVAFQRKHRLRANGVVTEATWRKVGGFPTAAAEAAAKADAARRKAAADRAAAEAAAKKAAEEKAAAEAAAKAAPEVKAQTANADRRAALLKTTVRSVHAPNLPLVADPNWHLARRLTYGPTPALLTEIKRVGGPAWVEQQLNPVSIDDSACERIVAETWPDLNASYAELYAMKNANGDPAGYYVSNTWLARATITRRIFSKRQLFEMVVEMWHDHLHVTLGSDKVSGAVPSYDRTVIRKHALGRFEDMLQAAIPHPAMVNYLDNKYSRKTDANENLGRELLELHTVGAGAFTETDVKQAAYLLTGTSHDQFEPLYRPTYHYVGPLKVMGYSHPNPSSASGPDALKGLLTYLANHPATAKRVAEKMCRRFVSDTPSAALVDAVAAEFTRNNTAITPTLRFLFNHPEFKASHGQKLRRPGEYITAMYRAADRTWVAPDKPTSVLGGGVWLPASVAADSHMRLAHEPLAWAAPNGYPDVAPAWQSVSGTVVRANLPFRVVFWDDPTIKIGDWATTYGITATMSAYTVVDVLSEALTGFVFKKEHRDAIAQFLWDHTGKTVPKYSEPVGADRLKWRLKEVVRLILGSPYANLR